MQFLKIIIKFCFFWLEYNSLQRRLIKSRELGRKHSPKKLWFLVFHIAILNAKISEDDIYVYRGHRSNSSNRRAKGIIGRDENIISRNDSVAIVLT